MSDTRSLFPPFGDPWPSCLLPSQELPDVQAGFLNLLHHQKSKRVPENQLLLLYWQCQSIWLCGVRSHYGRSHHDKVMRKRPETQGCSGYKGPSRLASASTPPCILPHFLLLFLFALLQILVLPAMSSPAPLSLNRDQYRTLINKSPGRWFPMQGPGMKEMFQVKTLLLALWLVWQMCTNAHDCSQHLNHKQHKESDHKRPW